MDQYHQLNSRAERFFWKLTNHAWLILVIGLLLLVAMGASVPKIVKDTSSDAFLDPANPAVVYRDKVEEIFGLSDPMVIAVVNDGPNGVFNPQTLQLVQTLTDRVSEVEGIDPERVMSLATEKYIWGSAEGLEVEVFLEELPETQAEAEKIGQQAFDMPLYMGTLVAKTGNATLIVAEILEDANEEQIYQAFRQISIEEETSDIQLYLAGEGAIAGFLGGYIDADASRLNPLAGLIITLIIFFTFRTLSAALISNIIVAASVAGGLGLMAASGVSFFVITNAVPVILIGISVADAIHIFTHYYQELGKQSQQDKRLAIAKAMGEMWKPISLTTLTTMAGFCGLYLASSMPPFKYLGLFSAIGVLIAWLYSIFFLPALIKLLRLRPSPIYKIEKPNQPDTFAKLMSFIGARVIQHPAKILVLGIAIMATGIWGTLQLKVDYASIDTFNPKEDIYIADKEINKRMNGLYTLDVVIETPETEDLLKPENLTKIEQLQRYAETLPLIQGSTSIADYLKQIHRSMNESRADAYQLPGDKDLAAQYLLLYGASSDPTDFEEEADYDYRLANIRFNLNNGLYSNIRDTVEPLQIYIDEQFNSAEIKATISGRGHVHYHWIKQIGDTHLASISIALLLVLIMSVVLFRSLVAGLLTLLPVVFSLLCVYAYMGINNIGLGIGTSMFASVAIGLGVDFAIHTVERLKNYFNQYPERDEQTVRENFARLYPATGRALMFNFFALACGFGVLISSQVVSLNNFGTVVVIAVSTSFLASLTLLPAIIKLFKPKFFWQPQASSMSNNQTLEQNLNQTQNQPSLGKKPISTSLPIILALTGGLLLATRPESSLAIEKAQASVNEGRSVMEKVNAVDDGEQMSRRLTMTLTDRRGKSRVRDTYGYRKYYGEDKKTVLFYLSPSNIKNTAFLTYDYKKAEDDQWLYLPAARKVRRISASDRGDYFLGTDFSYEDIKKEGKTELEDYRYQLIGEETIDGRRCHKVEGIPLNKSIAKELGYGRVISWVDAEIFVIRKVNYFDIRDNPLKTLNIADIRQVEGLWTRHKMTVKNHKTGHTTLFEFSDIDYQTEVADAVFSKQGLKRGIKK